MWAGELATRQLQQKGLVPIDGELTTGNADVAKPIMKQIARLGFGSTKPGRQDRSLSFTPKPYHLLPEKLKRLVLTQKEMKALKRKKSAKSTKSVKTA